MKIKKNYLRLITGSPTILNGKYRSAFPVYTYLQHNQGRNITCIKSASGMGHFSIDFKKFICQKLKLAQCNNGYASLEAAVLVLINKFPDIITGNEEYLQQK